MAHGISLLNANSAIFSHILYSAVGLEGLRHSRWHFQSVCQGGHMTVALLMLAATKFLHAASVFRSLDKNK